MSLTLEQLDWFARNDWSRDDYQGEVEVALPDLIEYARERAARERCEALWDGDIDTDKQGPKIRAWAWHGSLVQCSASGSTFTEAYLALAAELEKR